ncbi:PilN domain-containing protein [Marinobacterium arenosum]|uniref:PilN domain-containing protein n=1 Tax=Marinobacterium arenosum TaxID=2862496 RepID=UPI001C950338|nr:PilN domain-containing protein [Marinobacterium arenosum]MBY4675589.1 PilN domain-containing protein [Marinobacterium arenosum]
MANINLRPWREERTAQRQKQFVSNMLAVVILAALVVLGIGYYYDYQKSRQLARNSYLQQELVKLEQLIREIEELKNTRTRLLERLNAIQELQGNRPIIVRNFDELVRVLPDEVHYNSLIRKGEQVAIEGLARDSLMVSSLMRNLDGSVWFGEPNLSKVGSEGGGKSFYLAVPLKKPDADKQEAAQ